MPRPNRTSTTLVTVLAFLAGLLTANVTTASAARLDVHTGRAVSSGLVATNGCSSATVTLGAPTTNAVSCSGQAPLGTRVTCTVTSGVDDTCQARLVIDSSWGSPGDRAMSGRFIVTTASGKSRTVEISVDLSAHLGWMPSSWTTWQSWKVTGCGSPRSTGRLSAGVSDFGFQAFEVLPGWASSACV